MNSIIEECEASTDVLQNQVDEARERSQRELDELRRQLQEKGVELEKSRQAAKSLQDEVRRWALGSKRAENSASLPRSCARVRTFDLLTSALVLVSVACSAASAGGGSAAVPEAAAGGPAEVQTAGDEGGGAGGEARDDPGGERATRQTLGGKCL